MKLYKLRYIACISALWIVLYQRNCAAQNYSLGVNIASMAVGSINIELSKAVSQKVTIHLPLSWNPVTFSNNKKLKHIMIQPGIRWWKWHNYSGYFGGVSVTAVQFNAGINHLRYYGSTAGLTLSIGYAKMISKRWNIEAEVGIYSGWVSYNKYRRELCGDYEGTWRGIKLYPSKITLALIYII